MKAALLTTILLIIGAVAATACSCEGAPTVEDGLEYSEVVVSGTVESVKRVLLTQADGRIVDREANQRVAPNFFDSIYVNEVRLCITQTYKGLDGDCEIIIYTSTSGASCGISFIIGEPYTVYGHRNQMFGGLGKGLNYRRGHNVIWTHSCTRTNHNDDDEDLRLQAIISNRR